MFGLVLAILSACFVATVIVLAAIIDGQAKCGERCAECLDRLPDGQSPGTKCPRCVEADLRRFERAHPHFCAEHGCDCHSETIRR